MSADAHRITVDDAMRRIRACYARARATDSPTEAATAIRQAEALMRRHGFTAAAVSAAEAERTERTMDWQRPPAWVADLAKLIGDAFGCRSVLSTWPARCGLRQSDVTWIGVGAAPEIAAYSWDVLFRALRRARAAHAREMPRHWKAATRTRRADIYALGWVKGVRDAVGTLAGIREQDRFAIDARTERDFPSLGGEQRFRAAPAKPGDVGAYARGVKDGRDIRLRPGVRAGEQPAALGVSHEI